MGGIYIKGMEMPKRDATFLVHVNGDVIDITPPIKYGEDYHREKMFYKLIPVPPHGDLIDRDALMQREVLLPMGGGHVSYIRKAPTIIEAESEVE